MLKPGTSLTLEFGTRIRLGALLGGGGEGIVYHALDKKSGEPGVFKILKDNSPDRRERTKFLVHQRLSEVSELFYAPTDYYDNGQLGHFAPFAPGISLEEYLETPGANYFNTYALGIAYAHGFALLNKHGIAYCDPGLLNAKVYITSAGLRLYFVDFDNFNAAGVPPPTAFGQEERMAPELRRAWKGGQPACPDQHSDRYGLTTVLHDMVLAKSLASGFDHTEEELERARSGGWPHDPVYGQGPADAGGYPSGILNAELAGMFRGGLSANREERPLPAGWAEVLSRNYKLIWIDPRCHGPCFIDVSKTVCPHCQRPFPTCKLVFPSLHKEIVCATAAVGIGRAELHSPKVSSLHADVRRFGPETRLLSLGRNGTFRSNGSTWQRLTDEAILQPGDCLRFADVECRVEEPA